MDGAPLIALLLCVGRVGLGGMMLRAGVRKAAGRGAFASVLAGYRLVPAMAVPATAAALVAAECLAGALLLAGAVVPGVPAAPGAALAALLLLVFALAMAANLARGRRIPCGCGGAATVLSWRGCALTALLVPVALLCAAPAVALPAVLAAQAVAAGALLLLLSDAAGALAAAPVRA